MLDNSYSDDALNVRSAFFGVKAIIYVEGDDDVLFWQEVFSRITNECFEVESLGGSSALDEYIAKIASGQIKAIAARDADFIPILKMCSPDPKVVYTFGYSIENSLYTSATVAQLVKIWCKSPKFSTRKCADWLNQLASIVEPLVIFDAANAISGSGVSTIGDNCGRYMKNSTSTTICPDKVSAALVKIAENIPPKKVDDARKIIGTKSEDVLRNIRGHFLASAVHRYIVGNAKEFGKKVSISAESLYAAAILQFASSLDAEHLHKSHYLESARSAWQAL